MPCLLCICHVGNHLLLLLLIFLKIIEKKYDSSTEFFCTHFCHQMFCLYVINIPFYSFLLSLFSWFFLFFCISSLNLWPERQLLPFFYCSISGLVETRSENWNKWFAVWKLFKLSLNPRICWMLDVLYVHPNNINA